MKLKCEVLWFEDEEGWLKDTKEHLEDVFEHHGFELNVDSRASISKRELGELAISLGQYNRYDIIIFDYDLAGSLKGSDLAKSLRSKIYTDMVFYSGKTVPELRMILHTNGIDGVFPVFRGSFTDDIELIFEDWMKRSSGINSVRGMILDEVSKMEKQLRRICNSLVNKHDEEERTFSKMQKELISFCNTLQKKVSGYENYKQVMDDPKTTIQLIKTRVSSVSQRHGYTGLHSALSDTGKLKGLQDIRNRFAHYEATVSDNGEIVLDDGTEEAFSFDRFREIRKDIIELKKVLSEFDY